MAQTNSNTISSRQMARLLKKFRINNGDILAIKYHTENANKDAIEAITDALGKMNMNQVLVIVVDNFDDLTVLNETEMNKRGWFKLKSLAKFMHLPDKETND